MRNIADLEMNKLLLLKAPVKLAEVLNPFSSRSSSFFNFAFLDFFNRTFAKPLGS
jgi:hypothetical protein